MKIEFEDKQEKTIFSLLVGFGLITLVVNIVKIFTVQPASQYILLTLEMILGIGVLFVPFLFTKLTGLVFPKMVRLYYWFFLWIAVFLGTGLRLIIVIPFWDKILHTVSPILLVAVGYAFIGYYLRDIDYTKISPWLFIIMGFAFAGLCGVFWEFWEFICDSLGDMNLQRYMSESGVPYVGRAALMDTMGDLFTNTLGALVLTIYSFTQRHKPDYFKNYAFRKVKK
ncbi:hypothetical protein [Enterococcus rivorum]|uniref:Uncharacterized protein n=1 Tax=Enterococcus rivorum TaxID=762845 RepID=A0A1E5KY35_9ENTE|nr:hypothetical protein [Enterococcus rivorum]MBP2099720.1 hypothetical protein [Enterococcus rivorum]OEH82792.1 hypothetical protein BCR26_11715 [Enterococcus rivorum]